MGKEIDDKETELNIRLRVTREQIGKFKDALGKIDTENGDLSPKLRQAMKDGMDSMLEDLQSEAILLEEMLKIKSS